MHKTLLAALLAIPFHSVEARAEGFEGEVDLLEMHVGEGDDHFVFDSTFSLSGESAGASLKLEGGSDVGPRIDEVTGQLLFTFAPAEGTLLLAGARHDFREGADLTHGSLAVMQDIGGGVSAEHFLFLSEKGDLTGSAMVVASLPLAPTLAVEPRVTLGWSAQAIAEEETGAGLTDLAVSLRLRHAIGPVLNIYAGAIHERLTGATRDMAVAKGDRGQVTRAVIGAGLAF